jgi:LmbE family N-acetylglucosaminyl deacetylase
MHVAAVHAAPAREHAASRHIGPPALAPDFWPAWLAAQGHRLQGGGADALAPATRLVVVAPHPDDELLMAAGLVQQHLQRGGALCIVSVTDGEACFGEALGGVKDDAKRELAAQRRAEHAAGLQALGAGTAPVHRLGLADGRVAAEQQRLERRLRALLQPGDTVVSTWRLDGHPDHDATGRAAAAACARQGARLLEAPGWMWHWARPAHPAIAWQRLRCLGLQPGECQRKWRALQCHASQLAPRPGAQAVVDDSLQQRARWPFECFFVA